VSCTCADDDTIVRTSWVMGVRGKNVVHTIAERALSGANVRFVDDQMGTVTASSDLARSLGDARARATRRHLARRELPARRRGSRSRRTSERCSIAGKDFATPIASSELGGFPGRDASGEERPQIPKNSHRRGRRCLCGAKVYRASSLTAPVSERPRE
jgi:hypothetical protein